MANLNMNLANVAPHKGEAVFGAFDSSRKWSTFQTSIFAFVANDSGNAIVEAVAGSGKSTTIIEAMKLVRGSTIFLAFNKAIADELKAKGVNARTFHSLCFSPVMRAKNAQNPSIDKLRQLVRQFTTDEGSYTEETSQGTILHTRFTRGEERMYGAFAQKLVGLARQAGMGFLTENTYANWKAICDHHDLEPEDENATVATGIKWAMQLLEWSNESEMVDFDDMLYFAVKDNIRLPQFDFVFVDEAQDTNMIQREILRKIMGPNSRIIAVGDPAQAIYGFRGADANSLATIAREFGARTLPLSITYRCPTSVVKYAQQWVSHIQARDNAPEGVVQELGGNWSVELFKPNDLVVCRKSAPLMKVAFRCIRANIPVQVLGRDIGDGLKALIKKMNAKNIDQLSDKLETYRERELAKARKDNDEQKIELINDKVGAIQFLIDGLKEDRRNIPSLEAGIDYLFKDKSSSVKLCTIHKSKGLEAERVFWLGRSQCPAQWASQPWQKVEEVNLCYVAATRAKAELYLIEE
jgi:superfamily I DNA/RNA helicase